MQKQSLPRTEQYTKKYKQHKLWQKIVSVLACIVVFCTTYALILPAVTLEQDAYCGLKEHQHGEACYERELICGQTENRTEAGQDGHTHTEDCYRDVCVCQMEEHEHTLACYSDPEADLETPSVWESSLAGAALTGKRSEDVIAIAESQLGYAESTQNYIVTADGEVKGITRYGQWYGDSYGDWCATFVSFCLSYAGIPETSVPYAEDCAAWVDLLTSSGLFYPVGSYLPLKGDIVFFDKDGDGTSDYVGLVAESSDSGASLRVIGGDDNNIVQYSDYGSTDPAIFGYVSMQDNPELCIVADPAESESTDIDAGAKRSVKIGTVTEPIAVESYISAAKLYYRCGSEEDWTEATESTTIPGTAELKLAVDYESIPLSELLSNGGLLQFSVPSLLRDPLADGTITDEEGNVIGTVAISGNVLTIDFDDAWLNAQNEAGVTLIGGSFYVTSSINYTQIGEGGDVTLVFGEVFLKAHFEEDIAAKNGEVTLTKAVSPKIIETEDGDFAEYTLTVTAGEDGCPQVRVVDHFTANADKVSYVGISQQPVTLTASGMPGETVATGKPHGSIALDADGSMVWTIGDMAAGETRTLRYRVKLDDTYTYVQNSDNKLISNEALAYAAQYPKEQSTADLEPKAGLSLKKSATEPERNEDGSYTITYTLVAEANRSNMFTLKNVSIDDCLNDPSKPTNEACLPYIDYVADSFFYYAGTSADGTATPLQPVFHDDAKGFTAVLGDLAPGEAYCIQYQVHIEADALATVGGKEVIINNCVKAFSDNAKQDDFDYLATAQQTKYLKYSHWAKKLVGEPLTEDTAIPIGGAVYDATGSEPVLVSEPPTDFTAPAGSYLYTVLVNELGDWNVTSASMTDKIDGTYMQFVGYVKVEALDVENDNSVVDTIWVKVDGGTSFNFSLAQLGFESNRYAYRLSYYAEPKTIEGTAAVIVKNDFTLSGTIIPGTGDPFILTGVTASKEVILKGGDTIDAKKLSWYYEGPTDSVGDYRNGTLYWAIKVDGDAVRAGTYIQDYLQTGSNYSYIRADSLVGVYTSTLTESALNSYVLSEALDSGLLTEVESSYYSAELEIAERTQDYSYVTIKMEKTLPLNGKSLYIIIKTAPAFLPPHPWFGNPLYYYNYLRTSDDGQNWTERGRAGDILYEGTNIWKKVGAVFRFNGESIQETTSGDTSTIITSELKEPGLFVSWNVTVNYAGELSGKYRLEDTLPAGMELAYVRLQQRGSSAKSSTTAQISDLGADFAECSTTAKPQGESSELTTWYYTDGDVVIWDVDNLVAGRTVNNCVVTFEIVCRVTDPDVLLGGASVQYTNEVSLYGADGTRRDVDTQNVTVTTRTLRKSVKEGGRMLPFTITLNELGEDLLKNSDKLTVVDTLSDTLELDPTSVTVTNSETQTAVPFTASVSGNTLYITVPDGLPLTICYQAKVLAKPGEKTTIKNNAHWEGYTATDDSSVELKDYSYSVGGTAGGSATPQVEIVKYDSSSINTFLAGAEFEMVEGTMENGTFTPSAGKEWTGTTDAQGRLVFGDSLLMAYNTVYRITETKAPSGFVRTADPIYFLVAQANSDGSYPEYPDGVDVWYESDTYECRVGNGRGTATVTKQFTDLGETIDQVNGTYRFGLYDMEDPVGEPMQTATLVFEAGYTAQYTATFTDLELGKTYYIYELDDDGKAIRDGATAAIDGKRFQVTYANGSAVTIANDGSSAAVTVTNSVSYPLLPDTGGMGTTLYTVGGLLLSSAAAVLLLYNHKKRGKEDG